VGTASIVNVPGTVTLYCGTTNRFAIGDVT
jgi:hypothetical protein